MEIFRVLSTSMQSLINNALTDKNTDHSYIDTYETLFGRLRTSATRVMEIGIYDGGSIGLWSDYFTNASIYGVDLAPLRPASTFLNGYPRVNLKTQVDAYSPTTIGWWKGMQFDVIVDDGPHTLESMKICVSSYSKFLTETGVLVVEDIQNISWIEELRAATPDELKPFIKVFDLRSVKGRYDDILFVIDKHPQLSSE
jgi:hypothetical protein